ncbi:PAS domain-containing protein [Luteimonas sp. MHLX1A]|uniref:PAS domain-containing protein n=1 Tax=Alterluteimonas muca TaxID=2878684 RepID=UPI001E499F38|nr:PAS domain-containing protein [Luteimonas sp. MHLX1A]MCD9047354.1 PAS domain-containing protein [Luteimonas sp. MHLX1A]
MAPHDLLRVFETMPGHVAVLRAAPGFPVVAMSRSLQAMSSDPGNVVGRPLFELFPESEQSGGSIEALQASFERAVRSRAPDHHEQRFDIADRATGRFEERYWLVVNTPVLDDDGAVEYILHQSEDAATGRRHGSMAILDAMTEGVFTLDRQWRFSYVNPEAHRILRAEPGSLVGAVIWERFPGSRNSAFSEHYRRTMHERVATTFTGFYPGLEGWYEVTVYPAPEGISVYFRDVTARVLAEQDRERLAAESEHQRRVYETALDNTPDFVYVFGTDHRAIYANQALLRVWGVDDVRGRTWLDLGYEQWHADLHDRELAEVIATRAPIRGEIPFTGTNGRRIYDYIFAPVFDASGAVVAVAGTTRDITERQAAEQIIHEHAQRLAEADRAKDHFLATLSHELRNPLAPMRYGLEILRASTEPGGQQARIHSMMERQVDHLVRLVDDLMEVSRITRGTLSLQVEPVLLAEVVDSAVEASRPVIDAGQHSLVLDLPAMPVVVHGDRVRMAQILGNLLNNAARYSAPGGSIVLRARVAGDELTLSVIDSGVGMEQAEIPRLFEMFSRGEHTRASHQGGLGIGLALARRLAVLHGGSLDAVSDGPGTGSTFSLVLPLQGTGASPSFPSDDPDTTRLGLRVLLADDDADVGGSLAEALRLSGAEVHLFDNGGDALARFDTVDPHVAILDIGMPHLSGYEVARALRRHGVRTPLIALTGWGQAQDRERAFASGFDHHLVKPVAMPMLVDLLASIEGAARAAPSPGARHDTVAAPATGA